MPVRPRSASEFAGNAMPTADAAATPETEVETLAKIVPLETIACHDPSGITTAWDEVIAPVVDAADWPVRATVTVMTADMVPVELVAFAPESNAAGDIAPVALAADVPENASVFDATIAPADEDAEEPASDSVLDGAIVPADEVAEDATRASIGTIAPSAPVAEAPAREAVIPLAEVTVPIAVVADAPETPTVIPPTNIPAAVVDANPVTGVICPNTPVADVALVPANATEIA